MDPQLKNRALSYVPRSIEPDWGRPTVKGGKKGGLTSKVRIDNETYDVPLSVTFQKKNSFTHITKTNVGYGIKSDESLMLVNVSAVRSGDSKWVASKSKTLHFEDFPSVQAALVEAKKLNTTLSKEASEKQRQNEHINALADEMGVSGKQLKRAMGKEVKIDGKVYTIPLNNVYFIATTGSTVPSTDTELERENIRGMKIKMSKKVRDSSNKKWPSSIQKTYGFHEYDNDIQKTIDATNADLPILLQELETRVSSDSHQSSITTEGRNLYGDKRVTINGNEYILPIGISYDPISAIIRKRLDKGPDGKRKPVASSVKKLFNGPDEVEKMKKAIEVFVKRKE